MALSLQERKEIEAIICEGNTELLVSKAEKLGEELVSEKLKPHQIRRFFGTVRQIKSTWREDKPDETKKAWRNLQLLKPKLAYQRKRIAEIARLEEVLTYAIDLVASDRTRFSNFVDFFEAIVAYHEAHGG